MPYNWSNVKKLGETIQTTGEDVMLSGHGSYDSRHGETQVPEGVEFRVVAPLGASIADSLGQALEDMQPINYLGLKNPGSNDLISVPAVTVYRAGSMAPDYTLHAPRGIVIKPGGPHVLGVEADTQLSALWIRVAPFLKPGKTVRVYWAACTAIDGAKNQVVLGKE